MNAFTKKPDLSKWIKENKKLDKKAQAGKARAAVKGLALAGSNKSSQSKTKQQ